MTTEDVAGWSEFAVLLGGACAVLAGLVFLALSINVERILRVPGLSGRAGESVILFLNTLCLCGFVLVPRQPVTALGIELVIAGALMLGILDAMSLRALRTPTRQPRSWRITRVVVVQCAAVPVILAGTALLGWPAGGLYWFAAASLIAIIAGTGNAWVLLVEVVRDRRYRPTDDGISS